MLHFYITPTVRTARRRLGRLLVLGALALGLQLPAQAQNLNYNVFYSQQASGTYTDLGSAGTAIATANTDDANSAAQSIGFTFNYSGQSFTQFILNTNGYLKLGSTAPSATAFYADAVNGVNGPLDSSNPADVNLLLPFNTDLEAGASPAEYRVATTGTAPNRVCTIQWKNVSDKLNGSFTKQYSNFSFQVKLYETTNNIEFVYGAATANQGTAIRYKTAAVGVKGASAAEEQIVALYKEAGTPWEQAQFVAGADYFDFLSSTPPSAGLTYRFLPAPSRDAATFAVYTLGKLANEATPHSVQALVVNTGLTTLASVPVTLTVSGATSFTNTQTITDLKPGYAGYVTFAGYTPTATGANTVAVAVGADGQNGNNQQTAAQQVTPKELSYIDSSLPFDVSLSIAGAGSKLATRYSINKATVVSALTATFGNGRAAPYRLQLYNALGANGAPGDLLYTSDVQTRPATPGPVTLTVPNIVVDKDFYVVITEESSEENMGIGLAGQDEFPLRPNTFYALTPGVPGLPTGWFPTEAVDFYYRLALDVTFGPTPTCAPPTNVAFAAIAPTSANVTFTASAGTGLYVAEYGPVGFTPGTGTTITSATSPITLTGLSPLTQYDVYVSKSCGVAARYGPLRLTTACQPPAVAFPYSQNFDAANTLPCGYTIVDANNDGYRWGLVNSPPFVSSTPNAIAYLYNDDNTSVGADDWFFTQALPLTAGQQYNLSFKYRVGTFDDGMVIPEGLEIRYGTAPTVAAMTAGTSIFNNTSLSSTSFATAQAQAIKPAATGQYYIGFHAISNPNAFVLVVDDILITTTPLPVNQALAQTIGAYPNPTTGLVRLNLSASTARQRRATVFNSLGQVVLTRTLSTAADQQIDLSACSSGLYTVQLQLDNDVVVKRVSLVK